MPPVDTVVLVHGLWMHGVSMGLMRRRLGRSGHLVQAYSYPTVRLSLEENAERLARYCESASPGRLHFVAHSMGGLVALKAAARLAPLRRGRLVLVGTPFQDTHSGRRVQRLPGGPRILGRCMGQWLTDPRPETLDVYDIGVIAGDGGFGLGRFVAPGLAKPHDGVVSVEETRVPGMGDHIVLRVSHTAMLISREVVRQACVFLEHGHFDRTQPGAASVN